MGALTSRRQAAAIAGATLLVAACSVAAADEGDDLPDVVLPALDGFEQKATELEVDELDGPVVINLWAVWCPPCEAELPDLQRASEEYPDVRFIGVDEGFEAAESVAMLERLDVTYEQFVDVDGELAQELLAAQLPTTFVIDGDGEIVLQRIDRLPYDDLIAALDELD